MLRFILAALLLRCAPAFADAGLDAIRASVMSMRGKPTNAGPRGATAELTNAKHLLRDWAELQVVKLPRDGDAAALQKNLNSQLRQSGLTCSWTPADKAPCPDWSQLGYVGDVQFHWSSGFLVLLTGVGIECGYDESAYVYSWSNESWRRVWQNEQNAYTEKKYKPQSIEKVLISVDASGNDYIALTLGTQSWCESNWHDVYFRAFHMGAAAAPLIDEAQLANVEDEPLNGSVRHDDVLVEFTGQSLTSGNLIRTAVFHYRIEGNAARRIDPLALSPLDFVDEWLAAKWKEAASWSESANLTRMRAGHDQLHRSGEPIEPTMRCPTLYNVWQVGIDFSDSAEAGENLGKVYFLVRWTPPYVFRMVRVSNAPSPACTQKDPQADESRTLFPTVDWR